MAARRQSRGMALMIVLLVVALISVVATQLGSLIQLNIQQASNRERYQQAYWFALGGERLARELLAAALATDKRIHLQQAWANPLLAYPIEGGTIRIRIRDQQNCFNLNALSPLGTPQDAAQETAQREQPLPLRQLAQLLQTLDASASQVEQRLDPLRDWLDSDTLPSGLNGAEDLFYTKLQPPYLPANGPLVDPSEVNFIDGFRRTAYGAGDSEAQDLLKKLRPYLCTLPSDKQLVNLNTLEVQQAALLSALFEGEVAPEQLSQLLNQRPAEGFMNVDEFRELLHAEELLTSGIEAILRAQLGVSSEFFLARIEVEYHEANLLLYSAIHLRNGSSVVYQRRHGVLDE